MMSSVSKPASMRSPERLAVVIGAMRAGTTSLHQWFQQCPTLCVSRIKEPDFFVAEKSAYRGAGWYAGLFADPTKVCVDVSPNYAKNDVFPGVAQAIQRYNPNARIIYVIRDPVDRLISEYFHQKAAGADLPEPSELTDSPAGRHMLSTSQYASQIADYVDVFPAAQIRIVDMKALVSDPETEVARLLDFMGAPVEGPLKLDDTVSNDRASVERLPRAWLQLRRTRVGDFIRGAVPAGLHSRLKATFAARSTAPASAPVDFSEDIRAELRSRLQPEYDRIRLLMSAQEPSPSAPAPSHATAP